MMNSQEFGNWCKSLNLSQSASEVIRQIRAEKPSRRVQGGRGNVSGFYPSRKMGVTISFESHRHELARIYELEHNPDVLEYYDQPPAIELCYQSLSGRNNRKDSGGRVLTKGTLEEDYHRYERKPASRIRPRKLEPVIKRRTGRDNY